MDYGTLLLKEGLGMNCPYCGESLEIYEEWYDNRDGENIRAEEHWQCISCHRTFSRQATYKLVMAGMLEE